CGPSRATATRWSSRTSWTSTPTWKATGRRSTCARWRGRTRRRRASSSRRRRRSARPGTHPRWPPLLPQAGHRVVQPDRQIRRRLDLVDGHAGLVLQAAPELLLARLQLGLLVLVLALDEEHQLGQPEARGRVELQFGVGELRPVRHDRAIQLADDT